MDYSNLPPLHLSHSSIGSFHSCPRLFWLTKIKKFSAFKESNATLIGQAIHSAFQSYCINKDASLALFELLYRYPYDLPVSYNRSLLECVKALYLLIDWWDNGHYELVYSKKDSVLFPMVETRISIDIKNKYGIEFNWVGMIDLVIRDCLTGELIVLDIKTTTMKGDSLFANYKNSFQCMPYAMALAAQLGESKPISSYFPMTVKYIVVSLGWSGEINEFTFTKSQKDYNEWVLILNCFLEDYIRFSTASNFPRKAGSCLMFNKPCSFIDNCNDDESYLDKLYERYERDYSRKQYAHTLNLTLEI